jgi:CDP-glycerol glycerophosphotransferase (TagB/SpsB family)
MAGSSLSRRVARVAAGALPPATRQVLRRRLGHRLGIPGADAGLVSVVLLCDVRDLPRLPGALDSVLGQAHAHLEVLLCPVAEAVDAFATVVETVRDVRVRVRADERTWFEAAAAGVQAAHGDLLPPGALSEAVASLTASGSALAAGRLDQAGDPEPWLERSQRELHYTHRPGVQPLADLDLPGDLAIGSKLIRRSAWLAAGARFAADDDWLASPTIARLLRTVDRVDVLAAPTYTFAPDHGRRPFGSTPNPLPGLAAWHHRVDAVGRALEGSPLGEGWDRHVVATELPRLLQETERATDEQWAELRALAASYAEHPSALAHAGAAARALVWLAARDRREDVEKLADEVSALGDDLRTRVEGTEVLAEWTGVPLPEDVRRLSEDETALRTHVHRVRDTDEGREVDILVELRRVDLGDPEPNVDAWTDDGDELPVQQVPGTEATRWAGRRFQRAVAVRVRLPDDEPVALLLAVTAGEVVRTGRVSVPARQPDPGPAPVVVSGLDLDGTALVVTATGDLDRLRLLDPSGRALDVELVRSAPGRVRIELRTDRFGTLTCLGAGPHRLVTDQGNVAVAGQLRDRLPLELLGERHRLRPHLGPLGGLVLGIGAPLSDDELGPWAQERLREGYLSATKPVEPGLFYFESYAGRTATDSPLAILEELRRRRPDLTAYWGIADHSQCAPDGTRPVLLRSREWYDVLARVGCLVVNTDVEPWFRRRPGQVLLQTFHGYPSKAMGAAQWRALDYRPSRIREARTRGVDTWSAILTPTPEMTRYYREQYSYEGPALERGYPRDDALTGEGAGTRRAEVRRLLGIGEHQTAVLYAPTWREHLASRPRAADMTDFLDIAAAADALGDDHVLLLRGHRFHAPDVEDARVLDVTAYPEVNDLILAADAAVLDYSSLRFDFALTGRPMVFLVPDLEEYDAGSRSFLFPFAESAPGPFVRDTAGVVAELRDLDGLRARHGGAIAAFNATYHPWQDGRAAERVVDGLLGALDPPTHRETT